MRHPVASCIMASTISKPSGVTRIRRPESPERPVTCSGCGPCSTRAARCRAPHPGRAGGDLPGLPSHPRQAAAGTVVVEGPFVGLHRGDLVHLIRNEAERESHEHPMNRVMEVRELPDRVEVRRPTSICRDGSALRSSVPTTASSTSSSPVTSTACGCTGTGDSGPRVSPRAGLGPVPGRGSGVDLRQPCRACGVTLRFRGS